MKYYINGNFVRSEEAKISFHDGGFQRGNALFESIRFKNNNLFFLPYQIALSALTSINCFNESCKSCNSFWEVLYNSEDFLRVSKVGKLVEEKGIEFNLTLDHSHVIFKIDNPKEQKIFNIRKNKFTH